jgi:spore coat protein U-like protein
MHYNLIFEGLIPGSLLRSSSSTKNRKEITMKPIKSTIGKLALALAMVAMSSGLAMATGTGTGTLTVSAFITDQCEIGNSTLNFGAYNPASEADLTGFTALSVVCTTGTTAKIFSSTAIASRLIQRQVVAGNSGGNGTLTYRLFTDATRTTDLGNDDTAADIAYLGSGQVDTPTLYASITQGQTSATAGVYYGTANLTVSY